MTDWREEFSKRTSFSAVVQYGLPEIIRKNPWHWTLAEIMAWADTSNIDPATVTISAEAGSMFSQRLTLNL